MSPVELDERLRTEGIVALTAEEWEAIASAFEPVESHDTGFAGELLIARSRGPSGTEDPAPGATLIAVEAPKPSERVVRLLADEDEAKRFIEDRLSRYERMWDGCGCRIDYYGPTPGARASESAAAADPRAPVHADT